MDAEGLGGEEMGEAPLAEGAAAPSPPPEYEPCEVCGTPLVMRGGCIYCRALAAERRLTALSVWGDDEWMRRVAMLELDGGPGPRMHALGFYQELGASGTNGPFNVCSRPQILFRPEILTVAPECAAYGMLVDVKVGNRSQFVDATPLPLSVFSPSSWASIEMMREVAGKLMFDTASIAQDITLCVDLTLPTDPLVQEAHSAMGIPLPRAFKAVLWGRAAEDTPVEALPAWQAPPMMGGPPMGRPMGLLGPAMGAPAGPSPFEGFGALPRESELAAMMAIRRTPSFHKLVAQIEKQARKKLGR